MKRVDLLRAAASLPFIGALIASPAAQKAEEVAGESYQFGHIVNDEVWELSEMASGRPTVEMIGYAVRDGFNYVWQYTTGIAANGNPLRFVHGVTIGR